MDIIFSRGDSQNGWDNSKGSRRKMGDYAPSGADAVCQWPHYPERFDSVMPGSFLLMCKSRKIAGARKTSQNNLNTENQ